MKQSWTNRFEKYAEIANEICEIAWLTNKDSVFWRIVAWLLFLCSFGQFKRQRFLEEFATTLGPIQAYPKQWQELSRQVIIHEARHTQQFLFAGWFVPIFGWLGPQFRVWVGLIPMTLVYGFFPLPMFFAWGRFRLELDADAYAWRISLDKGLMTPEAVRLRARQFAETVSSWAYLRAWPRSWAIKVFEAKAEQVIAQWQSAKNEA